MRTQSDTRGAGVVAGPYEEFTNEKQPLELANVKRITVDPMTALQLDIVTCWRNGACKYAENRVGTTMPVEISHIPETLISSWRLSSSAEIRIIRPSLTTTIFVPVWMAVLRAISVARRSATRALRRSGSLAFDMSLLIISFLPIQGGLALDLGYQISPSCPQDVYRMSQSYAFQHRSGGE
jgi:hypothetical protein